MKYLSQINWKKAIIAAVVLAVAVPFLTNAGNSKKIYVDDSAKGTQNGTSSHPYKSITKALKNVKKGGEVYVRKGTYKENIVVPEGVEIIGADKEKVTIEAKDKNGSVVILKGKASLTELTIKGGSYGVKVSEGGRVKISNCKIKNNKKNGIDIKGGNVGEERKVSITDSDIEDNGGNGVYSQARNIVIMNSEIENNKIHGVQLEKGVRAWMEKTSFDKNYKDGLNVKIGNSKIYTSKLTFTANRRNGVEVVGEGISGRVDLKRATMTKNSGYAVTKVIIGNAVQNWSGLSMDGNTKFIGNVKGTISPIIKN